MTNRSRLTNRLTAALLGGLAAFVLMITYMNAHLEVMRDLAYRLGDGPFLVVGAALLLSGAIVGQMVELVARAVISRAQAVAVPRRADLS